MADHTEDYLLDKQVRILQPLNGYRASSDAVLLSSLIAETAASDKILDVGSGTGAVSLCLARRFAETGITGLEIQPELCALANQSAAANGFVNLQYLNCDICQKTLPVTPCSFSHVITNPPYAERDMPSPNLSKALAHNHHGSSLNGWLNFCLKMLKPFGRLYLINRSEALAEIITALSGKAGGIKIIPVFSKPGQNAKRVMVMAQKDSKAPPALLPPLYIHRPDGSHTRQAAAILRGGQSYAAALADDETAGG